MSGFMAQAGSCSSAGTPGTRWADSLYEAVIYVAGKIASLGSDARIEELTDADVRGRQGAGEARRLRPHRAGERHPGGLRPRALQLRRAEGPEVLMDETRRARPADGRTPPQRTSSRPRSSRRSSGPRPRATTRSAAGAPSGPCPSFDDLLFLTASLTRYPLEGYREKCETTTVLGTRFASKPIELDIPDHDRRHELRRPVGNRQDRPRPGRDRRPGRRRPPATAA